MNVVEHAGNGDPIVLLHGATVAGWMWEPHLPALAGRRVLVPDLPGFGESAGEPWHSLADTADAVAAILDGPAHLVGLSLGSSVAIEVALRHPHLVRSLLLASPAVAPQGGFERLQSRLMLAAWGRRWFWEGLGRAYGLDGDDRELFVQSGLRIRPETATAIADEVARGVPAERLAGLRMPVLAVAGGRDSATVRIRSLDRLAPVARTAIAPGLHHQFSAEDPALFDDVLLRWLDDGAVSERLAARE